MQVELGAWSLLDMMRVSALRPGPSVVILDEFSALGREGRHVVPLLARTREAGMACTLATHGLAGLAQVDSNLPQQVAQNTTIRLVLRQGSAEDQQAWSGLLGARQLRSTTANTCAPSAARPFHPTSWRCCARVRRSCRLHRALVTECANECG